MSGDSENGNGNGNGGNGHPIFHFWDERDATDEDDQDVPDAPPERIEEYHLDCRGKKRLFRLEQYGGGVAGFLSAQEVRKDEHAGLRVVLPFDPETEAPPYFEIRKKLAARLATRHVVRNPDTGSLEILNMIIRGQISYAEQDGEGPSVLIDDEVVSWEALGRMLQVYEGWGVRIQVTDVVES